MLHRDHTSATDPGRWRVLGEPPSLSAGEIHVWRLPGPDEIDQGEARSLLSPGERRRAKAFRFREDRTRFVARRAGLRRLLSGYVGHPPGKLRFRTGREGKPHLEEAGDLRFNATASGALALAAVGLGMEVGVDVERIRPLPEWPRLARRWFSPAEARELARLSEEERLRAFFCTWTRKEAYVKAVGRGLGHPLGSFTVTVDPREPPRLLEIESANVDGWSLEDLQPADGFVGAVASGGGVSRVLRRSLS